MKKLQVSKNKVKNYLSERLARSIVDADENALITVLRYNAIGGFEYLSDEDLFEFLSTSIPELDFLQLAGSDEEYLHLAVKKEYRDEEDAIVIDIQRAIQVI
jgi:uncharacterized protein YehS (DUF1456 family)